MAARQAFAHYETFARLHTAGLSDLVPIQKFRERLPDEAGMSSDWWRKQVLGHDRHVLVATECQLVVGIAILEHLPSAADARVSYFCVAPDARRRGIAQLLLQTLVGRARAEGAALVQMSDQGQADLGLSLLRAGFRQLGGGDWCFGLWDGHIAHSYSDLHIPEHEPVSADEAAAQSLLLVMGTIDENMLLTRRAQQIVQHELGGPSGRIGASELAFAAARRGFSVWLAGDLAEGLSVQGDAAWKERIQAESDRLSPERILGHLSRAHLSMLRLTVPRLTGDGPRWYIVDGFDGYLFRVHDVTAVDDPNDPSVITASELRVLIGACAGEDQLVVGKPL